MDKYWKKARRLMGLSKFEKSCRRTMDTTGRMARAYLVPGTREAGEHAMLCKNAGDLARRLEAEDLQEALTAGTED